MEQEESQSQPYPRGRPKRPPSARRIRARARRKRFMERYEQRRTQRAAGRHHTWTRPLRVTTGVGLILGGVAIGWLPGPGFVVLAFPGALLVASEWRRAAILMDRMEHETIPYMRRLHAKLRGGPKTRWVEEDPHLWTAWIEQNAYQVVGEHDEIIIDVVHTDTKVTAPDPEDEEARSAT